MGRTDGKRERCEIKDALRNMRKVYCLKLLSIYLFRQAMSLTIVLLRIYGLAFLNVSGMWFDSLSLPKENNV